MIQRVEKITEFYVTGHKGITVSWDSRTGEVCTQHCSEGELEELIACLVELQVQILKLKETDND